ncbi:hypothetical protein D2U88_11285 [Flagellimonas aequoris]|uniref:Uncharacterized protein n=1 Tax=Flagellimonas aequoris TaxID=2306997 RepID=A0A418N761_9FLAO|nr:hypothetical protein D2U88_11285 [Allomuricauda aequoris]
MVALAVQFLVIQYVKSVGRDMSFFGNDLVPIGSDLYLLVFRYRGKNQGNDQNHKKNYTFSHFNATLDYTLIFGSAKIDNKNPVPCCVCMNGHFLCIIGFGYFNNFILYIQ